MTAVILRGDAARLPLPDDSVDLIVTSPPYFGLRAYSDGGEVYDGQIGSEATPAEYLTAFWDCTREWMRVLKPQGSLFVNLGDKYANDAKWGGRSNNKQAASDEGTPGYRRRLETGFPAKSLMGLPWRYGIGCVDDLGLICRAEIVWDKPNGLPESVTDRVRRSHEQVFHFTRHDRYYSGVDEIREPHTYPNDTRHLRGQRNKHSPGAHDKGNTSNGNPLGKLPGSVWGIASQPLVVPSGQVDHFAAFPMELPRRIILGWSPSGICTDCGEGRFPVASRTPMQWRESPTMSGRRGDKSFRPASGTMLAPAETRITGYACACTPYTDHEGSGKPTQRRDYNPGGEDYHTQGTYGRKQAGEYERVGPWREYHLEAWTPPPTRPALVVDPFGGTGTTSLVADVLGRTGISFDRSADYCRLARWRTTDPGERARAMGVRKPPPVPDGQGSLFGANLEAS
jgi:DNA modification methylase